MTAAHPKASMIGYVTVKTPMVAQPKPKFTEPPGIALMRAAIERGMDPIQAMHEAERAAGHKSKMPGKHTDNHSKNIAHKSSPCSYGGVDFKSIRAFEIAHNLPEGTGRRKLRREGLPDRLWVATSKNASRPSEPAPMASAAITNNRSVKYLGRAFPSQRALAQELGVSEATIVKMKERGEVVEQ